MSHPFYYEETSVPWEQVIAVLGSQSPGTRLGLNKWTLPHPATFGMYPVIYPPIGQLATYYKVIQPALGFLAIDFGTHYDCQLDHRLQAIDLALIQQALDPVPGVAEAMIAGGTALGAALGASLGKTDKSVAAGALIGAALAALFAANSNKR